MEGKLTLLLAERRVAGTPNRHASDLVSAEAAGGMKKKMQMESEQSQGVGSVHDADDGTIRYYYEERIDT